jgi:hypothetical protein
MPSQADKYSIVRNLNKTLGDCHLWSNCQTRKPALLTAHADPQSILQNMCPEAARAFATQILQQPLDTGLQVTPSTQHTLQPVGTNQKVITFKTSPSAWRLQ